MEWAAYCGCMIDESKIAERFAGVGPELNERQRRLWAASEARALGYGGIAAVSRATRISEDTVGAWPEGTGGGRAVGGGAGPASWCGAAGVDGV